MRILLIALSVALLGFAPAPFPKAERQRADPLDVTGLWEFVECEVSGSPYERTKTTSNVQMTKEQFIFVNKQGGTRTPYVMRLDPTASPPSFTWGSANSVSWVGSYRLQGDQMTLIFSSGTSVEQRPTDFNGKPQWRYVLRRVGRR
jgi:uncharacterized protein (TIGR03067 family)